MKVDRVLPDTSFIDRFLWKQLNLPCWDYAAYLKNQHVFSSTFMLQLSVSQYGVPLLSYTW